MKLSKNIYSPKETCHHPPPPLTNYSNTQTLLPYNYYHTNHHHLQQQPAANNNTQYNPTSYNYYHRCILTIIGCRKKIGGAGRNLPSSSNFGIKTLIRIQTQSICSLTGGEYEFISQNTNQIQSQRTNQSNIAKGISGINI
ncbi:hypothetical protein V8G54_001597 [Vigna mungo]|uniref:Uncharacterized protein n=1 Tax=Vigna mungo TaxID=3915 RepID=A0AAQ3P7P0_VIGMU